MGIIIIIINNLLYGRRSGGIRHRRLDHSDRHSESCVELVVVFEQARLAVVQHQVLQGAVDEVRLSEAVEVVLPVDQTVRDLVACVDVDGFVGVTARTRHSVITARIAHLHTYIHLFDNKGPTGL